MENTERRIYCMLANAIDGRRPDDENGRKPEDPWVELLMEMASESDARAALLCTKKYETLEEIAQRCGKAPESFRDDLYSAAEHGVAIVIEHDGRDVFKLPAWAPGIAEYCMLGRGIDPVRMGELFRNTGNIPGRLVSYPNIPLGRGPLRTIPIGRSIEAKQNIVSHEEVKTYLDQSDYYSVADCACRKSAYYTGDPCEHEWRDRCIQIGDEARYYVRTGRGRRIDRAEAEAILAKAEQEGLVHQIFNNVGAEKSPFICNCCGCSCMGLSGENQLRTTDFTRSNYRAEVTAENCVACGACVEACNMNALRLGTSFCDKDKQTPKMGKYPADSMWTADDFNPDWNKKIMTGDYGTSPCKTKCPAHISIQGYIRKAAQGKYDEALKVIKRDNPFPAVCGRICPHSCENECTRARVDEAMAIDDIKKFIADKELEESNRYVPEVLEHYTEKIAVIGAGPSGLTAAYYAAAQGYPVTVFERSSAPGGMLRFGIPSFRLEKNIIDAEIDVLRKLGVEFRCGVEVGKDVTIDWLRAQGYKAFYLAVGARKSRRLNIPGEELDGVMGGIDFLRSVNLGETTDVEGDTVVIGGGNVAIDVSRAAIRLGNRNVKMFCLEKDEDMPTVPDEKDEAIAEGISINNCWGPKRILGENGKVTGVEFMRCVSVLDENGRFDPVYDGNETVIVPCSNVYTAIGQSIVWNDMLKGTRADTADGRTVKVDAVTWQTEEPDIFAGGDCATGPKFTIDAIAAGKAGAITMHRYLRGRGLTMRREREYRAFDKDMGDYSGYDKLPRQRPRHASAGKAVETMRDTRADFTEEQLKKEAQRCLGCGVTIVDPWMCIGCGVCATKCEFDAMHLVKVHDVPPAATEMDYLMDVKNYAMKRYQTIMAKQQAAAQKD